jgi:pilus assembly protein FimV
VSKITLNRWLIAVALLLPCAAGAAGMGRLTVLSALGQPFNAEVELVSVQKEDLGSLSVRLASPEAYRQANLQYGSALIGLRIAIETRPNGQPFVRVTSSRPVNEPFLDLLLELNWASGRLVREFTALLDPPGIEPPPTPAVAAPAPALEAPVPGPRVMERMPARAAAAPGQYGPIERGETLSKIAGSLKPEGVSLEQMLVGLYRSNPDAFISKNMNLVRTGKILRVPEANELAAISQREAVREYRAHVADWKRYRAQVADTAAAAREGGATSGRITTRIDDKAAAEPKDVVRLSKSEAPTPGAAGTGTKGSAADRIRMLEEEVTARERALKEANERVAQLEKTIKDMQRLAEIKSQGMAAAQQQAQAQAGMKPEAPKPASDTPSAAAPPKPGPTAASPESTPKPQPAPVTAKAPDTGKKDANKPKPTPVVKAQPKKETGALETVLDNPMYLGGAALLLAAGLGYVFVRRRRESPAAVGVPVKEAPTLVRSEVSVPPTAATEAPPVAADAEIDPLDEANIHITGGRDAQAQAILNDAIARDPGREALQMKLLELDALRKDKAAFARHATEFHKRTDGAGENWQVIAAMGAALDPENPLFSTGKTAPAAATALPETDLDFNVDAPAATAPAQAPAATDFEIEIPPAEPKAAATETGSVDFPVEVPKLDVPPVAASAPRAAPAPDSAAPLDFKLDLGALDLSLDDKKPAAAASSAGHDPHWHDVEAKFDLAKAYQEMGEKSRAADALREAMQEGDTDQRLRAMRLLESLG